MELILDKKTKTGRMLMTGALTLDQIGQIRDTLRKALADVKTLIVDVEGASDIDLTFLQLMCSAHRSATAANKSVSLSGKNNPAMQKAMADNSYIRASGCRLDKTNTCLWVEGKNA